MAGAFVRRGVPFVAGDWPGTERRANLLGVTSGRLLRVNSLSETSGSSAVGSGTVGTQTTGGAVFDGGAAPGEEPQLRRGQERSV